MNQHYPIFSKTLCFLIAYGLGTQFAHPFHLFAQSTKQDEKTVSRVSRPPQFKTYLQRLDNWRYSNVSLFEMPSEINTILEDSLLSSEAKKILKAYPYSKMSTYVVTRRYNDADRPKVLGCICVPYIENVVKRDFLSAFNAPLLVLDALNLKQIKLKNGVSVYNHAIEIIRSNPYDKIYKVRPNQTATMRLKIIPGVETFHPMQPAINDSSSMSVFRQIDDRAKPFVNYCDVFEPELRTVIRAAFEQQYGKAAVEAEESNIFFWGRANIQPIYNIARLYYSRLSLTPVEFEDLLPTSVVRRLKNLASLPIKASYWSVGDSIRMYFINTDSVSSQKGDIVRHDVLYRKTTSFRYGSMPWGGREEQTDYAVLWDSTTNHIGIAKRTVGLEKKVIIPPLYRMIYDVLLSSSGSIGFFVMVNLARNPATGRTEEVKFFIDTNGVIRTNVQTKTFRSVFHEHEVVEEGQEEVVTSLQPSSVTKSVMLHRENSWNVQTGDGKEITLVGCDSARAFSCGYAAIKKNGQWGFSNSQGQVTIPPQYEEVEDMESGYALVKRQGTWYYVARDGKEFSRNNKIVLQPAEEGRKK